MEKKKIEFSETDEMYNLTDKILNYEYIDRKELDRYIGGESEKELEHEINAFLENLHGEMVDLVKYINDNFKNIGVEMPISHIIDVWVKHYKKQIDTLEEKLENKSDADKMSYWGGYDKSEMSACKGFVRTLEYIKEVNES